VRVPAPAVKKPTGFLSGPHQAVNIQSNAQLTDAGAYRPLIGSVSGIIVYFLFQTTLIPFEQSELTLPFFVVVSNRSRLPNRVIAPVDAPEPALSEATGGRVTRVSLTIVPRTENLP